MVSICVCRSATWSSVASGDTMYTSSYFLVMRLLLDYGPSQGKESVGCIGCRGTRVVHVHHLRDAVRGEHLGGIGRPRDERLELGRFVPLESREHVVRQIASV